MKRKRQQFGINKASGAPRARRWPLLWTAVMVLLTAGYFQNSRPGWNANSQLALTYAIVERGTLSIDAYQGKEKETYTEDKAFYGGHYYCDKSPVTAFLGVPAFWAYSTVTRGILGQAVSYTSARYWTTWGVEGLAAAALAVMTALLLLRRGVAPGRAALAGFLWIAASPFLAYSILFFSYLPACAFAMGGFLIVERLWSGGETAQFRNPQSAIRIFAAGALLGLATWTLNTLGLVALALTVGIVAAPAADWQTRLRRLAPWALGGMLGVAGQFIYSRVVFHSWASPYAFEANPLFREQMARGLMGATRPRLLVAWLVTFSPFQGLFLLFPLVAAALAGCLAAVHWARRRGERLAGTLALGVLGALVLYNSAYYMWWGGCGYLPRHLIPSLVLLTAGLVPWLAARQRWPGWVLLAIAVAGVALNLPAVALNPQHPMTTSEEYLLKPESVERWQRPLAELHHFFWSQKDRTGQVVGVTDQNWGTALGFKARPASLIPLLMIWVVGAAVLLHDREIWRQKE